MNDNAIRVVVRKEGIVKLPLGFMLLNDIKEGDTIIIEVKKEVRE